MNVVPLVSLKNELDISSVKNGPSYGNVDHNHPRRKPSKSRIAEQRTSVSYDRFNNNQIMGPFLFCCE